MVASRSSRNVDDREYDKHQEFYCRGLSKIRTNNSKHERDIRD
jgi:hypothetical protein